MVRQFQEFVFQDLDKSRDEFLEIKRKIPYLVHLGVDKEAAALYELAAGFHDNLEGYVLEFGTFAGASAACMAAAVRRFQQDYDVIYAIDPYNWHPETLPIARSVFTRLGIEKHICQIIHYDLDFVRQVWRSPTRLIYVDADHHFDHVIETLDLCYPLLLPGGWIALHDYGEHTLKHVVAAVNTFVDNHDVEVYQVDSIVCIRKPSEEQ